MTGSATLSFERDIFPEHLSPSTLSFARRVFPDWLAGCQDVRAFSPNGARCPPTERERGRTSTPMPCVRFTKV